VYHINVDTPPVSGVRPWFRGGPSRRALLVSGIAAVVILILGYILAPARFPHIGRVTVFPDVLILSLDAPIKDSQGLPYSGVVRYEPTRDVYSYIATSDSGTITPIGPGAFSSGTNYLATRMNASSTDLVLYDRATLSPVRVVERLAFNTPVLFAGWSADSSTFGYVTAGDATPTLIVEDADSASRTEVAVPGLPIGLSPDGGKVLVQGTPMLSMVSVADGERTTTTGTAFINSKTRFLLSPSGQFLITLSDTEIAWYAVDWEEGAISSVGKIATGGDIHDAAFLQNDTLLIRDSRSDQITHVYAYQAGKGMVLVDSFGLILPEGAHILQVVSW